MAGPGIVADVVVVSSRGDERGGRPQVHHQLEAQHAQVEAVGGGQVAHLQVHVPQPRARLPGGWGSFQLRQELIRIQGVGPHAQLAARLPPGLARTIAVQLDAVALRVGQVDGLAHQVIGEAFQAGVLLYQALQRAGQGEAGGQEQGQMVQAGRAVARGGARALLQRDHRALRGAQAHPRALLRHARRGPGPGCRSAPRGRGPAPPAAPSPGWCRGGCLRACWKDTLARVGLQANRPERGFP